MDPESYWQGSRATDLVSPPTRGWTSPSSTAPGEGSPRPRGDGPLQMVSTVSPPTRGWTRVDKAVLPGRSVDLEVSPPTRGWTRSSGDQRLDRRTGFPRPRGDGPACSPRAKHPASGFPAHAGMDPAVTGSAAPTGDGAEGRPTPVSPPTRGWTQGLRTSRSAGPPHGGFPAHAGMDPIATRARRIDLRRFPRPRGDGPLRAHRSMVVLHGEVSPPTRGWTRWTRVAVRSEL